MPASLVIKIIIVVVIGFIGIGIYSILRDSNKKDTFIPQSQPVKEKSTSLVNENENVTVVLDILNALNWFYLSTQNNINENSEFSEIIQATLTSSNNLKNGIAQIEKYINHPNEVIQLSTEGMVMGANQVIQANDTFVSYLRSPNIADADYQAGLYLANQKEGYQLITLSAPQITTLLYEPAASENPTGKVPYKITEAERKSILNTIERLFGDELRLYKKTAGKGDANSIIFTVNSIYKNIYPDTYEQFSNQ